MCPGVKSIFRAVLLLSGVTLVVATYLGTRDNKNAKTRYLSVSLITGMAARHRTSKDRSDISRTLPTKIIRPETPENGALEASTHALERCST